MSGRSTIWPSGDHGEKQGVRSSLLPSASHQSALFYWLQLKAQLPLTAAGPAECKGTCGVWCSVTSGLHLWAPDAQVQCDPAVLLGGVGGPVTRILELFLNLRLPESTLHKVFLSMWGTFDVGVSLWWLRKFVSLIPSLGELWGQEF